MEENAPEELTDEESEILSRLERLEKMTQELGSLMRKIEVGGKKIK